MDVFVGRRHIGLLLVFLLSTLGWAIEVHPASADSVIYIRADGRIDPAAANITTADNVTYTFTDNNYASIVVERSNITVDGQGHTLQGADEEGSVGFYWNGISNVTLRNTTIDGFWGGIYLANSSRNSLCGNYISWCLFRPCIELEWSSHNLISGNTLRGDGYGCGIGGGHSSNNNISGNDIEIGWRSEGLWLTGNNNLLSGNRICGNSYGGVGVSGDNNTLADNIVDSNYGGIRIDGNHNSLVGNNITANYGVSGLGILGNNTIISGNNVGNNEVGIELCGSFNIVSGNDISRNTGSGIEIYFASNNVVCGNNITENGYGVELKSSSNNTVVGSNIADNGIGIYLRHSYSNEFYHNSLVNNSDQIYIYDSVTNLWDAGYPAGGNYWSDYNGTDGDGDGIGDVPYVIDVDSEDRYPLMCPWNGSVVPSTQLRVEPQDCVLSFMQPFTVNITLTNVAGLYGYEFWVRWNVTLFDLVAVSVTPPTVWGSNYIVVKSNGSDGTYWHALSALAPAPAFDGNTTLLSLTFNVTSAVVGPAWYNRTVETAVMLEDTLLADSSAQAITHATADCGVALRLVVLGDLNGDRVVNIFDVVMVAIRYGQSGPPGWTMEDVDGDGHITIFDIVLLATNYGVRV